MDNAATDKPLDKRCREAHPERITAGDIVYERQDLTAARYGETERSVNNRDKDGAPFKKFGNIKYRPLPDYDEFIAEGIRRQQPLQAKRHRRSRAAAGARR